MTTSSFSSSSTMTAPVAECHALPCSINFTGKAPTAPFYFRPAALADVNETTTRANTMDTSIDTTTTGTPATTPTSTPGSPVLLAASLRGRGLLSVVPSLTSTSEIQGRLLRVDDGDYPSTTTRTATATILSEFPHIQEWHHEHQISVVVADQNEASSSSSSRRSKSRVRLATEWCHIAAALHQPIPVGPSLLSIPAPSPAQGTQE
jgi:Ribonuclease H2 non-catalytic subunit (Ylr154p-like)